MGRKGITFARFVRICLWIVIPLNLVEAIVYGIEANWGHVFGNLVGFAVGIVALWWLRGQK